jgi:hypothetical protein
LIVATAIPSRILLSKPLIEVREEIGVGYLACHPTREGYYAYSADPFRAARFVINQLHVERGFSLDFNDYAVILCGPETIKPPKRPDPRFAAIDYEAEKANRAIAEARVAG